MKLNVGRNSCTAPIHSFTMQGGSHLFIPQSTALFFLFLCGAWVKISRERIPFRWMPISAGKSWAKGVSVPQSLFRARKMERTTSSKKSISARCLLRNVNLRNRKHRSGLSRYSACWLIDFNIHEIKKAYCH